MIPALLVGIGEEGRRVVRRTRQTLQEFFPSLLPAVRTVGLYRPIAVSLDEQDEVASLTGEEDVLFPCEQTSSEWFENHRQEFQQKCYSLTDEWLDARNLQQVEDVELNACDVILVASSREELGAFLALPVAEAVGERMRTAHPGLAVRAELLVLLPEGDCEEGAMVAQFLQHLEGSSSADSFPIETVYLVSPANQGGIRLNDGELRGMVAHFLLLRTVSDLSHRVRREYDERQMGRMATLGLSVLEFPAHALVRRWSRYYGQQLVARALLQPDPQSEAARRTAQNFAERHHLQPGLEKQLRERLLTVSTPRGERRLEDELTIGAFLFDEVPCSRWHIALATFEVFFRRERFGRVMNWLEENANRLRGELVGAIQQQVDEVVESHRDPSNALTFLAELNQLLDEMRQRFFTVEETKRVAPPSPAVHTLELRLEELRRAVASIPTWPPIIVKALLLTLLLALPFQMLLNQLAQHYGEAFAWLSIPLQWVFALLGPALPVWIAGWRAIQKATARAYQLAHQCVQLIEGQYKSQLHEQSRVKLCEILDALFLLTLDTDTLQREYPRYEGPNECREVQQLQKQLKAIPRVLAEEEADEWEAWRLDVFDFVASPPDFPYREEPDFNDWEGECQRLIESGFLRGWRQTDARELVTKVVEFTWAGVDYILHITLDRFVEEHLAGQGDVQQTFTNLYNRMRRVGQPFLLVREEGMKPLPHPLPALANPESSNLQQNLASIGGLHNIMQQTLSYPHPYEFVLLQLAYQVKIEKLRALPKWQKRLETSLTDEIMNEVEGS